MAIISTVRNHFRSIILNTSLISGDFWLNLHWTEDVVWNASFEWTVFINGVKIMDAVSKTDQEFKDILFKSMALNWLIESDQIANSGYLCQNLQSWFWEWPNNHYNINNRKTFLDILKKAMERNQLSRNVNRIFRKDNRVKDNLYPFLIGNQL